MLRENWNLNPESKSGIRIRGIRIWNCGFGFLIIYEKAADSGFGLPSPILMIISAFLGRKNIIVLSRTETFNNHTKSINYFLIFDPKRSGRGGHNMKGKGISQNQKYKYYYFGIFLNNNN